MKVVVTDSGAPAALTCDECDARGVAVIALGKGAPEGPSFYICLPCLIVAAIELADVRGDVLSIRHSPARTKR